MAARLCEKARPYGVVFDESVGTCLLKKDIAQNYLNDKVFLKGLTGKEPIRIYFTKGTVLPSSCKKPLDEPDWNTDAITITTNELESFSVDDISIVLTKKPLDTNQILAKVNYPLGSGTGWQSWNMNQRPEVRYEKKGKEHRIFLDRKYLIGLLKACSVQPDVSITVEAIYPVGD